MFHRHGLALANTVGVVIAVLAARGQCGGNNQDRLSNSPLRSGLGLWQADPGRRADGDRGNQCQRRRARPAARVVPRDSKANADEAVRLARELIIKDSVDFLARNVDLGGSAGGIERLHKENKIVFVAPTSRARSSPILRTFIRTSSAWRLTPTWKGRPGAGLLAQWKDVKTVATIAPDYAYGRDSVAAFIAEIKKIRPDIQIVDQQWPKFGEPDFTAFITAQMGKKADAIYCSLFAGDFVTFVKEATPLGYFKAINNRMVDAAEVGTPDAAQALGNDYPYGIIANAYDPVQWGANEPAAHHTYIENLKAFTHAIRLGLVNCRVPIDLRTGRGHCQGRRSYVGGGCESAAWHVVGDAGGRADLQCQVA